MKSCPTCSRTYADDIEFCPHDATRLHPAVNGTEAQLAAGLSRRYRIVRRLGQGGMGAVFLAEQLTVGNRPVALKILSRKLLDDPDFLLRFRNEAASTGRIHHANVVTIYESGQADDGTPYIAMEYLEGESLRQALTWQGHASKPKGKANEQAGSVPGWRPSPLFRSRGVVLELHGLYTRDPSKSRVLSTQVALRSLCAEGSTNGTRLQATEKELCLRISDSDASSRSRSVPRAEGPLLGTLGFGISRQ